jgi:hypothetical protein
MQKIKTFFYRIWGFIKKHKWSVLLVLLSLLVGGFFIWDSFTASTPIVDMSIIIPEKKPVTVSAPLSGRQISEEESQKRPIAIVVENHPDARPQAGLNDADIVFETIAEGGITRFLAIFHSQEPQKVGPVRSARSYFVEWARGFDALFAHVGGSAEAIELINRIDIDDLNQYYFGRYYWRDTARYAPHNVYTTLDKLRDAAKTKKFSLTANSIEPYTFKDDVPTEKRPVASKFTVNFNASYAPTYTYDPITNSYKRSILGIKQLDANTKKQVEAKNVVVAFSNLYLQKIRTATYTMIDTTDSGTAYIYQDGVKIVGKWSRSANNQIKFYGVDGKPVVLNVGTTWVDFVAKGTQVK